MFKFLFEEVTIPRYLSYMIDLLIILEITKWVIKGVEALV